MAIKTQHILAKRVEAMPGALAIITDEGRFEISWEDCSEKLRHASPAERSVFELSPSGYGIHWPLIDEDLAVGPLVRHAPK